MLKYIKEKMRQNRKKGKRDTRGGLGAVGIENWILQNGGSFEKAAREFLEVANQSQNFEEFQTKYYIWDFGENYVSVANDQYPHDNFVNNMDYSGYRKMKDALAEYIQAIEQEKQGADISETLYSKTIDEIIQKQNSLYEKYYGKGKNEVEEKINPEKIEVSSEEKTQIVIPVKAIGKKVFTGENAITGQEYEDAMQVIEQEELEHKFKD